MCAHVRGHACLCVCVCAHSHKMLAPWDFTVVTMLPIMASQNFPAPSGIKVMFAYLKAQTLASSAKVHSLLTVSSTGAMAHSRALLTPCSSWCNIHTHTGLCPVLSIPLSHLFRSTQPSLCCWSPCFPPPQSFCHPRLPAPITALTQEPNSNKGKMWQYRMGRYCIYLLLREHKGEVTSMSSYLPAVSDSSPLIFHLMG